MAGGNSSEKPEVSGPAPAFKQRVQAKRLRENVYFTVAYPEFGIAFLDAAIQKRVNGFIKENGGFASLRVQKDEAGAILPREISLGYALHAPKPGILSLVFSEWSYDGGPHGHADNEAATYDLRSKKRLRLGDIFPRWGTAKKDLPPLLKNAIENFDESCPSLKLDALSPDDTNFYLNPDGLTLVYGLGYAPPSEWECSFLPVEKDALEEIGADMRYWKDEGAAKGR